MRIGVILVSKFLVNVILLEMMSVECEKRDTQNEREPLIFDEISDTQSDNPLEWMCI